MSAVVIGMLDSAIEALEANSTAAPVVELIKAARAALYLDNYVSHGDAWKLWPDQTPEHQQLRAAYIQGALDATPPIDWER